MTSNSIDTVRTILDRNAPNRMRLDEVIAWCVKAKMPNTANYLLSQMNALSDSVVCCKDRVYYIDTKFVEGHFTIGDNSGAWRKMECDVATFVGLEA